MKSPRITSTQIFTLLKFAAIGVLLSEAWYFGFEMGQRFGASIAATMQIAVLVTLDAVVLSVFLIYGYTRQYHTQTWRLIRSARLDILLAFLFGIQISRSATGIGHELYSKASSAITLHQLFLEILIPCALAAVAILRSLQLQYFSPATDEKSFLISDVEKESTTEDLLDLSSKAEIFAERVVNLGSTESIVFGIDAPWGIGKSTFVNFCREFWKRNHANKVLVYKFNPLRYENRSNLLEKFVDGLIGTIQSDIFVPEIYPLISKYARFMKGKAVISLPGLNLEVIPESYTIDEAFNDLKATLSSFPKKIIIVIDDLDRLDFSSITDILFTIKKSFTLPNVSYVLCYDSDNIALMEAEKVSQEKISEFLEKFVNVKTSLYLDADVLDRYASDNVAIALEGNSQADPILVSAAMGGLRDIYRAPDFHRYMRFIGDVRKLKRFLNTVLMLELEKTDFANSDIDKRDLAHLILIYINYPNIFRKIYATETGGKRGFFSALVPGDEQYLREERGSRSEERRYANSYEFGEYLKDLEDKGAQFLLNQVFDVGTRLDDARISSVPENVRASYACFNGGAGGNPNLEEYLNLIVKLSKPQIREQHKVYVNAKDEIKGGASIEKILQAQIFSFSEDESSHDSLWRILVNSAREFDPITAGRIVSELLIRIDQYSVIREGAFQRGLRATLSLYLIELLDSVGWSDGEGYTDNTSENIAEIAEWIFGEGRHRAGGVIEMLSMERRGVLGLYDLMVFRLFCCADRGSDNYNLQRALVLHADPKGPTSGPADVIVKAEMRELSQRVFNVFRDRYIVPRVNIFDVVSSLTTNDMAGAWAGYLAEKTRNGELEAAKLESWVAGTRSMIGSFILYQLGNKLISSGIGCGYYDAEGEKNQGGISAAVNDYLFDVCFSPASSVKNVECFVDYLLTHFVNTFGFSSRKAFVPQIGEITKVLDREKLKSYWRTNRDVILNYNLEKKSKSVVTLNYTASYTEDLLDTYKMLDELL